MRISDWSSDVCSSDLNYEFGWKTSWGPVRFNGAIYQQDWNDIQLSFLGLNGLSEIRNAGVARIRGIELDLGYRQNGFSINAGMSYNEDRKSTRLNSSH